MRALNANKKSNEGVELNERQHEQAVNVGTEQSTDNAYTEILHNETLYTSPKATEEVSIALKQERCTA